MNVDQPQPQGWRSYFSDMFSLFNPRRREPRQEVENQRPRSFMDGINFGPLFNQNFMQNNPFIDEEERSFNPQPQNRRRFIVITNNNGDGTGLHRYVFSDGDVGEASNMNGLRGPLNFDEIFRSLLAELNLANRSHQRPASQSTIDRLREVEISEEDYEKKEDTGEMLPPTCPICTSEMEDKAIQLN